MAKLSPKTLDLLDALATEARSRIQPDNPTHAMLHQLIEQLQAEGAGLALTPQEIAGFSVDMRRIAALRDELMAFAAKYRAAWMLSRGLAETPEWLRSGRKSEAVFFAELFAQAQGADATRANELLANNTDYSVETALAQYAEWLNMRNALIAAEAAHAKLHRAVQLRAGYAGVLGYLGMHDFHIRLLSSRVLRD